MTYDEEVGTRLKALRSHKGLSRERLANMAEISAELVKAVERGSRKLTLRTAQRIAPILGISDLGELYGPAVQLTLGPSPSHTALPEVRRALTAWRLNVDGEPSTPEYLRNAVDAAWQTWHTSKNQRSEVAAILPGLLDTAQRTTRLLEESVAKTQALAMLAQTYHLAQAYLAWHGERELLWVTADRGMTAALDADDPLAIAGSTWYAAHLLRSVGRSDEALEQLHAARRMLERYMPDPAPDEWIAMLADLWQCSALTRARSRDQAAWADWDQSRRAVERLPEGYAHPWTKIGSVLVDVGAVMIATELGDPDEARRRAQHLDPEQIPSTDRRARHYIELARGTDQEGSPEATTHLLGKATSTSAETVRHTPAARDMLDRLQRDGGAALRTDVAEITRAAGLVQE